jgi:hypothetical protein
MERIGSSRVEKHFTDAYRYIPIPIPIPRRTNKSKKKMHSSFNTNSLNNLASSSIPTSSYAPLSTGNSSGPLVGGSLPSYSTSSGTTLGHLSGATNPSQTRPMTSLSLSNPVGYHSQQQSLTIGTGGSHQINQAAAAARSRQRRPKSMDSYDGEMDQNKRKRKRSLSKSNNNEQPWSNNNKKYSGNNSGSMENNSNSPTSSGLKRPRGRPPLASNGLPLPPSSLPTGSSATSSSSYQHKRSTSSSMLFPGSGSGSGGGSSNKQLSFPSSSPQKGLSLSGGSNLISGSGSLTLNNLVSSSSGMNNIGNNYNFTTNPTTAASSAKNSVAGDLPENPTSTNTTTTPGPNNNNNTTSANTANNANSMKIPRPSYKFVVGKVLSKLMVSDPISLADLIKLFSDCPKDMIHSVLEIGQVLGIVIQSKAKDGLREDYPAGTLVYSLVNYVKGPNAMSLDKLEDDILRRMENEKQSSQRIAELHVKTKPFFYFLLFFRSFSLSI